MSTCRFGKTGGFNGFLHNVLGHAWIQVVAAFPLGIAELSRQRMGQNHRSPSRNQTLLMDAANAAHEWQARSWGLRG
jgi:hypothetical protein